MSTNETARLASSSGDKKKRKRGLWSADEDRKLLNFITTYGVPSWSSLPNQAGLERCAKSCRLRWMNHLRPELKRVPISQEEEKMIIDLHRIVGNRWAMIAERMSGRTDNEIKNYYNCRIKKRLLKEDIDSNGRKKKKLVKEGIVPNTHDALSLVIVPKAEPTNNFLAFQSNGETNSNDIVFTSDMLRSRKIGISQNDTFMNCKLADCETQTNRPGLKSDCEEALKQDPDVKRLEEYVNALSALLC